MVQKLPHFSLIRRLEICASRLSIMRSESNFVMSEFVSVLVQGSNISL